MRESSEYTWFSLLRKQKQIPMDLLLTFLTGTPGDEVERSMHCDALIR